MYSPVNVRSHVSLGAKRNEARAPVTSWPPCVPILQPAPRFCVRFGIANALSAALPGATASGSVSASAPSAARPSP